jgi:hypothetical protein
MRADGSHVETVQLRAPAEGLFVEWPRWSTTAVRPTGKERTVRNTAAASSRRGTRPSRTLCGFAHLRVCAPSRSR